MTTLGNRAFWCSYICPHLSYVTFHLFFLSLTVPELSACSSLLLTMSSRRSEVQAILSPLILLAAYCKQLGTSLSSNFLYLFHSVSFYTFLGCSSTPVLSIQKRKEYSRHFVALLPPPHILVLGGALVKDRETKRQAVLYAQNTGSPVSQ